MIFFNARNKQHVNCSDCGCLFLETKSHRVEHRHQLGFPAYRVAYYCKHCAPAYQYDVVVWDLPMGERYYSYDEVYKEITDNINKSRGHKSDNENI